MLFGGIRLGHARASSISLSRSPTRSASTIPLASTRPNSLRLNTRALRRRTPIRDLRTPTRRRLRSPRRDRGRGAGSAATTLHTCPSRARHNTNSSPSTSTARPRLAATRSAAIRFMGRDLVRRDVVGVLGEHATASAGGAAPVATGAPGASPNGSSGSAARRTSRPARVQLRAGRRPAGVADEHAQRVERRRRGRADRVARSTVPRSPSTGTEPSIGRAACRGERDHGIGRDRTAGEHDGRRRSRAAPLGEHVVEVGVARAVEHDARSRRRRRVRASARPCGRSWVDERGRGDEQSAAQRVGHDHGPHHFTPARRLGARWTSLSALRLQRGRRRARAHRSRPRRGATSSTGPDGSGARRRRSCGRVPSTRSRRCCGSATRRPRRRAARRQHRVGRRIGSAARRDRARSPPPRRRSSRSTRRAGQVTAQAGVTLARLHAHAPRRGLAVRRRPRRARLARPSAARRDERGRRPRVAVRSDPAAARRHRGGAGRRPRASAASTDSRRTTPATTSPDCCAAAKERSPS